jgi:RNA polymerase sigma factor for flagellar operon FliA
MMTVSKNPYEENLKTYRDELAVNYMPAVKAMAARLKERLPSSVEFNDLVSIGLEELVKLSRRYDPKQNDNFWGYAQKRIYGSMLDFLRSLDTVSRSDRKTIKDIERIVESYQAEHDVEPDDEYIAEQLDIEVDKVRRAKNASEIYNVMPIEDQMNFFENVSKKIEEEELIETIKKVLTKMSEKEQLIIQLYYFEELSLKEISEILGVTESRISQIHKNVIKKLRKELNG